MRRLILILCVVTLLLASFAPAAAQAQAAQTIHIVERGETLAGIARLYGVTVQALASANGILNPNILWAGQRLIIPTVGYPPPPPTQPSYYIVRYGDTLSRIARQFNTTIWAIAQANNIINLNRIYAGMYLIIPGAATPGNPNPPPPQTVTQYVVLPGDTLARIARQFGTTVQAIAAYNSIANPNVIYRGQLINIPIYR